MRSYEAARGYFSFLGFIAWCAIIGGIALALMAGVTAAQLSRGAGALAFLAAASPGLILIYVGFFNLVYIQTARAGVDSAEYAQQALKLSRDQFAVSKEMLRLAEQRDRREGYAAVHTADDLRDVSYDTEAPEAPASSVSTTLAHGLAIEHTNGGYEVEGETFPTLVEAQKQAQFLARTRALEGLKPAT